jgi:tripartite-type tricarboxylate transporter receptor subunit TctC
VVSKLNAEVAKILATPEMREKLAVLGTEVRTAQPEALGTFIATEKTRWAQVIKESGIKFD